MTVAATLTLTLDPDLLDRFVAEADAVMRPADDVLRDLVRDFVDGRRSARDAEIDRALREADDRIPGALRLLGRYPSSDESDMITILRPPHGAQDRPNLR